MYTNPAVEILLQSGCPSIKYRIRSEILGQSPWEPTMVKLQDEILQDALVREVIGWQQPDGWLACDFHGTKSIEAGVRILCEKGVRRDHPVLVEALVSLDTHPERLKRGIGKVGPILDEKGLGGPQLIRAVVCAYAGVEEKTYIKDQIGVALEGFKTVLAVDSLAEVTEEYRGSLVFKPGVNWPSIYHMRLLAFTQGWRNTANFKILVEAIKRLVKLSPIPEIGLRYKSQRIAPASFCMHDFDPKMQAMIDADWMSWFHRMELLARLGLIEPIPELTRQVEFLVSSLDADGLFTQKLKHSYFTKWGAYGGLMLEADWRSPSRRISDLTFRSLLIRHYSRGKREQLKTSSKLKII